MISDDVPLHPFIAAYAEQLGLPVADRVAHPDHSPILEVWGVSLHDAVAKDLRPVVLLLAATAACDRRKRDVPVRLADWIGRIELADWYDATGLPEAAAMVRQHGEITDADTFLMYWPTGAHSSEWWQELEATVARSLNKAGLAADSHQGASAESLCGRSLTGAPSVTIKIAAGRDDLCWAIDKLAKAEKPGFPLPDHLELRGVRGLYDHPLRPLARSITLHTAHLICDLVERDADRPPPAEGHLLYEIGDTACAHAAKAALAPQQHAAHMREIDAFSRIALGRPFVPAYP